MCQLLQHRRRTATIAVMGWLVLPMARSFLPPPSRRTHLVSSTSFRGNCRAGIFDRFLISNNCNQYPINQSKRKRSYIPFPLAAASPSSTSKSSAYEKDVLQMSTSQLLQLLNNKNIRYAPNATRSQLEELVLQYRVSAVEETDTLEDEAELESRTFNKVQDQSSKSSTIGNQEVVDAIVLNEEEEDIDNDMNSYPKETGGYTEQQPRDAYQQRRRYNKKYKSRRREADVNKRRQGNSRKRHNPTASAKNRQRQQRNTPHRQNNYDLYANTYPPRRRQRRQVGNDDDEFSLPDDKQNTYDNGLQIFLMGFYEAGKTGVQLGLDAINPFSSDNEDGEWWYDEEEGRDILDVSILDYSPHYERGGESVRGSRRNRRRRREQQQAYSTRGRRRSPRRERRQQYDTNPRMQRYAVSTRGQAEYDDDEPPPFSAQSVLEYEKYAEEERKGQISYSSPPYTNTSEPTATNTRRRRSRTYNEDLPRYGSSDTRQGSWRNETAQEYADRRKARQWKDRVRRKFDAALGLDYQAESWRSNMDELDDRRKEVLRRQMKVENDSDTTDDDDSKQASDDIKTSTPPLYRNNRRARMRVKSIVDKKQSPPSRRNNKKSPKSRLDEVPFWREGGTLASLLFDTRPSRDGKGYTSRRKSLEQLLLSPFGRHHTVTSLFLYISRSTLTAFSILCRWAGKSALVLFYHVLAGVRGTIPQPIVVLTAFAAVVSSRGGKRMLSLTLTLLAMRLVGEFLHGSLHGNEFWDDEHDKEAHDWEPRSESSY